MRCFYLRPHEFEGFFIFQILKSPLSHFLYVAYSIFGIMKNNAFVSPAQGRWFLNVDYASSLERLINIQAGLIKVPEVNREEFFACYAFRSKTRNSICS